MLYENNFFWNDKRVVITGGEGFLGRCVVEILKGKNPKEIIVPPHSEYDLTKIEDCDRLTKDVDLIIHLAVDGGGIGYMKKNPGSVFYNNIVMNTLLQESARKNGVKKFVGVGSVCAYPKFTPSPFKEEDLWEGYPEETNASYGLAKKMMMIQSQSYREQYGFNAIHLMPTNLYGPRDDFDLKDSHVIPALIRKIVDGKEKNLAVVEGWGSGNVSREFLYVEDCARAIVLASEKYNGSDPINLGSGNEITIRDLADKIKDFTGFKGEIKWDTSKPDGQPRRCLDISKAKREFDFEAKIDFDEGLSKTIQWFTNKKIKLMKNTFYNEKKTKEKLIDFISSSNILSMNSQCKKFEEDFSKYQGRKYSALFNSGSSANLALIQSLINLDILKKGDKVGFSALTWSTNAMPLIQLGLDPIPLDVFLENLNVNSENLLNVSEDLKALFITNLLGFSGDLDRIKEICEQKGIILLEDNCESLGSELKGVKLGNFGLASTFSFYVGHHLSTIEGGMVCTDNKEIYDMLLMVRAHGWNRNLDPNKKNELMRINRVEEFYEPYTFYYLGYNLRPTEITGFLGNEQLSYIEEILRKRNEIFKRYEDAVKNSKSIEKIDVSHLNFVSNFAYPLTFKNKEYFEKYKKIFSETLEIRPIVGGNIVDQPFFKFRGYSEINAKKIHSLGFYIPNNPDLTEEEIEAIVKNLKSIE